MREMRWIKLFLNISEELSDNIMRKRYDKAFMVKVAIEAVRREKTTPEIWIAYSIYPNLISL